jgi:hypothetical protein
LGQSALIDLIVQEKRIDVEALKGKWEATLILGVEDPAPGLERALLVIGSDRRGAVYGLYELSLQIGVSPWHFWADVPVTHRDYLGASPEPRFFDSPAVKYRGIFLNDEAPALTGWVAHTYGMAGPRAATKNEAAIPEGVANYDHRFYEKIFELLLRLKANYLWPAMWNNAFNEDDPENPRLANEFGIVMGTSHQEPMDRSQKEWDRRFEAELGHWDYSKHADTLEKFWAEGVRRNKGYENLFTMGLRGANDTEMEGGIQANIAFLERIVTNQRSILARETGKPAESVPQLWCLYKEVQKYYQAGLRVPDDVTLLWSDDNWGNLRRLPTEAERKRSGGAGIYYHFDYHGGPRSYQWINSNPLAKVRDQMTLALRYGADRVWVVNVGHFKGYELPTEYFLDLAYRGLPLSTENTEDYTRRWAAENFGAEHAESLSRLLSGYTRLSGRRKPELFEPETYSLTQYQEAERVLSECQALEQEASRLKGLMAAEYQDAFFGLVYFPIKALAILHRLYVAAGRNALAVRQGRASAANWASKTRELFVEDLRLMAHYNDQYAGGKWKHFMDQTHIGYVSWCDPATNNLDAIPLLEPALPHESALGVAVQGSEAFSLSSKPVELAVCVDPRGATVRNFAPRNPAPRNPAPRDLEPRVWLDLFATGKVGVQYSVSANVPWLSVSEPQGEVRGERRLWLTLDAAAIPEADLNRRGRAAQLTVLSNGVGQSVSVYFPASAPRHAMGIEAEGFISNRPGRYGAWTHIPAYGHRESGMRATDIRPVPDVSEGLPAFKPEEAAALEYRLSFPKADSYRLTLRFGASLNIFTGRPLRFAWGLGEEAPRIEEFLPADYWAQERNLDWEEMVRNSGRSFEFDLGGQEPGERSLMIYMAEANLVLESLELGWGEPAKSYLGAPS